MVPLDGETSNPCGPEGFPGDSDPHLVENPTNRIDAGLEPEKEPRRQAFRDNDALRVDKRGSGYATVKRGGPLKQGLALCNPQIVRREELRSGRGDEPGSVDAFTDELLQEVGHGSARLAELPVACIDSPLAPLNRNSAPRGLCLVARFIPMDPGERCRPGSTAKVAFPNPSSQKKGRRCDNRQVPVEGHLYGERVWFYDARGHVRRMGVSTHPADSTIVISLWQGDIAPAPFGYPPRMRHASSRPWPME